MDQGNPYAPPTDAKQAVSSREGFGQLLFSFEGRIPRRTYWAVSLGVMAIFYVVVLIAASLLSASKAEGSEGASPIVLVVVLGLYIPLLWITFALQGKRWHDRGKSALWVLINFVPIIGGIWSFVEVGCLRGTVGDNAYGPDPT
jgi:uncharacterized membrane protein YhaH (DUF805 family)